VFNVSEVRVEHVQMVFRNPWGGPHHTEFSIIVELAKGVTTVGAAEITKWLLAQAKEFFKEYRKKTAKKSDNHSAQKLASPKPRQNSEMRRPPSHKPTQRNSTARRIACMETTIQDAPLRNQTT
jgi:hypothetical protein